MRCLPRLTLQPVVVEVGGMTSVEARMRVGGVATSVTVKAEPIAQAAVGVDELSSAAVGSVVTPQEMERLPVNGRRWQTFALLTPEVNPSPERRWLLSFRGVAVDAEQLPRSTGDRMSRASGRCRGDAAVEILRKRRMRGGRALRAAYGRERSGWREGMGGTAGVAYTFSQEAVREFRVSGQNYSALYGHAAWEGW